jgi:hypothetical protein
LSNSNLFFRNGVLHGTWGSRSSCRTEVQKLSRCFLNGLCVARNCNFSGMIVVATSGC